VRNVDMTKTLVWTQSQVQSWGKAEDDNCSVFEAAAKNDGRATGRTSTSDESMKTLPATTRWNCANVFGLD
jgi:hypothetical protein